MICSHSAETGAFFELLVPSLKKLAHTNRIDEAFEKSRERNHSEYSANKCSYRGHECSSLFFFFNSHGLTHHTSHSKKNTPASLPVLIQYLASLLLACSSCLLIPSSQAQPLWANAGCDSGPPKPSKYARIDLLHYLISSLAV